MACRTVTAQIQIELIIFLIQSQLFHTLLQDLQIVFTLAAANDLADTGYQAVHSSHSLAILVQLHVECLNLLRIIGYEYRSLKFLLGQVSLMLGLQIASPEYLVIEFVVGLNSVVDRLPLYGGRVLQPPKWVEALQFTGMLAEDPNGCELEFLTLEGSAAPVEEKETDNE